MWVALQDELLAHGQPPWVPRPSEQEPLTLRAEAAYNGAERAYQ